MRFTLA